MWCVFIRLAKAESSCRISEMIAPRPLIAILTSLLLLSLSPGLTAQIEPPDKFVGHPIGADKKLFGWEKVAEYFWMLHEKSDRIQVEELGKTTLGKPFLMATISSPHNLMNLAKYKNLQKQAASPYHLSDDDARLLARENKVVVMITLNIHSTEIASSQASIELAYNLATDTSARLRNILENSIILLIPSLNPDGMQMVVEWYNKYLDTPYEGSPMPYLYHPYAGHDNNRDWFMMNLVETRLVSKQYYEEWFPHIVYDQHQMGSSSARLFLPPYADPVNPNLHPLLHAQMNKFGKHIASELQAQGFKGIVTDAFYTAWWEGTSVMTPWWHNMMGILSEVASAQIATPLFFPKGSLQGGRRGLPEYSQRMNFLDPWPGGWWRLRDIIDYELAITFSLLDLAAREKESIVYNFCKMNMESIQRGKTEPPFAYVIPAEQHDPVIAVQMIATLMHGGVDVHRAEADFTAGHLRFSKGDYVILLSQPFRPYVKDMLERQRYPELRNYPGGPPIRPYDLTGWTLPLMMGVDCIQVDAPFDADLSPVTSVRYPTGNLTQSGSAGYLLPHRTNRSFIFVNRLLNDDKKVYWFKHQTELAGRVYEPGMIYIPADEIEEEKAAFLARELSIDVERTHEDFGGRELYRLRKFKLGLYQPWTANKDEGWTRLLLERFAFPYETIHNHKMRSGVRDFDVIILPDMTAEQIIDGHKQDKPNSYAPEIPKEFEDGIMNEGVEHLQEFVREGGTLITLDSACDFAIDNFGLPVENVLADVERTGFFCPGSLLRINVDPTQPVAFGMPTTATAMFANSPAFRPLYWSRATNVVAHYPDRDVLASGWLLGEDRIQGRSAVLDVPMGKGRVVLIGFRCQNRAQTPGTYKFLFNAIHLATAEARMLEK